MKVLEKIIARMLCFMHQGIFRPNNRPNYIFNNKAYFLDFRTQKFPLIFSNSNPFKHQQALHFGVLNYENQAKEGTCKVSGRSVIFSAIYAEFCLCPKSVIITTLNCIHICLSGGWTFLNVKLSFLINLDVKLKNRIFCLITKN